VGDKFRIRARQFPALVNCTQLDWFHGWPHEALLSVAQRFLADVPDVGDDVRASMAQYMAQAHEVRLGADEPRILPLLTSQCTCSVGYPYERLQHAMSVTDFHLFLNPPLQFVSQASQTYLETYRRYNYTTPKSYLELISLCKTLLARKRAELQAAKERLQNGVEKIAQASAQVRAYASVTACCYQLYRLLLTIVARCQHSS
jgi:dynein heavy chain